MIGLSRKTYLSEQIRLISLATYDLFTEEEYAIYSQILSMFKQIQSMDDGPEVDPTEKSGLIAQKKLCQVQLTETILKHDGTPRTVRLRSVLEASAGDQPGITWKTLKPTKKIAEFVSAESRALGLKNNDITFDKIIINWKNLDVLRQIVLDGFFLPILYEDGTVEHRKFRFMTASAGQLRTDKIQCISEEAWARIHMQLLCGLTWEMINERGGINVNKLLAYIALGTSATDAWDFPIDHCIVIDDFEGPVTGLVDYIDKDYRMQRKIATTVIKHTDGCGMMLPRVSRYNRMVRAPWIKGLLTSFDYIEFCRVNGCPPVIKDAWKDYHDLVKEEIWVIFTKSQFKLWNYYESWEDYKQKFKACNCTLNCTNYEDEYIPDCEINYQMLQTLEDFTDEELDSFTAGFLNKIQSIANNKQTMLETLKASEDASNPYGRALFLYPELLRDGYSRQSLKSIKHKMTFDGRSGKIKCKNKRLFAIPDMYAACQYWFLHIAEPEGLLKDGEVSTRLFRGNDKLALLRSPHLYMEWTVREVVKDPEIYHWFYTNGVYTSCHDLISKVLAFDVDGDQLNCVSEPLLIEVAERNLKKYDVVPLLFDLGKAGSTPVNNQEFYNGLKRAHDYSGIGQVSNSLTKLWNRDHPDRYVAGVLTFYNNLVIDAAKTGFVNSYEQDPVLNRRVSRAIGGKHCRMPFFFQFSKNGRKEFALKKKDRKKFAKQTNSTMNRLCERFMHIGHMNFNGAEIPPFNWQMMLPANQDPYNGEAVELFCQLDDAQLASSLEIQRDQDLDIRASSLKFELMKQEIIDRLMERFGSVESTYCSVAKYLFAGSNFQKPVHKQMFWRVYGDIACDILRQNMQNYSECPSCGMKIPAWASVHDCTKVAAGFFACADCGKICRKTGPRQNRCEDCKTKQRKEYITNYMKNYRSKGA